MVQKEVKKKAQAYGLMAILLASVCVALIYSVGTGPLAPLGPSPSANPNGNSGDNSLRTFASYDELKNFLATNSPGSQNNGGYSPGIVGDVRQTEGAPSNAPMPTYAASSGLKGYSTTNIQVAGVDEADTVKTDGRYLYVIANNSLYILDADPANAKVLQKISIADAYISGMYLSTDGNRLAVLGNTWIAQVYDTKALPPDGADIMLYPYYRASTTFVYVYDVSNKNVAPALARNVTMTGNYLNSRMIDNYLYNIVTEYAYMLNGTVMLPAFYKGNEASNVPATNVFFTSADISSSYQSYTYTTFMAVDLINDAVAPSNMTVMLNGADQVYVSKGNIYVTYPNYQYVFLTVTDALPPTSPAADGSTGTSGAIAPEVSSMRFPTVQTSIYRIHVSGNTLTFAAQGNVTGTVLQQYAMDETDGYFRIATTAYVYNNQTTYSGTQQNNVYVLDLNLNVVGKVENIGTGENFHAARFIGNRCYLVTFMTTDPLFVIDLSQPTNPTVLGELVMPGYSDYLHPYDETHLIGLGKEATVDSGGSMAWYKGLKLSLFDVSNVNAPTEIAKIEIGDRGTNSEALYNPKAFLFDKSRDLLVIPIELHLVNKNASTSGTFPEKMVPPTEPRTMPTNASDLPTKPDLTTPAPTSAPRPGFDSGFPEYGEFVWQGVYVFKVTLEGGFEVRGNITQIDDAEALLSDPSLPMRSSYQWNGYNQYITRALFIDDVLYTISNSRVQLNDLNSLALIAKVELD